MIPYRIKKYRYLHATYRAQTVFTNKLGYTYKSIPGSTGFHKTNTVDLFEIHVGKNQSLEDRVITFAHEIGHALDLVHRPMSIPEKSQWNRGMNQSILTREIAAWKHGWKLLEDMLCARYVEERFGQLEAHGIQSYQKSLENSLKSLKRNKKC